MIHYVPGWLLSIRSPTARMIYRSRRGKHIFKHWSRKCPSSSLRWDSSILTRLRSKRATDGAYTPRSSRTHSSGSAIYVTPRMEVQNVTHEQALIIHQQ